MSSHGLGRDGWPSDDTVIKARDQEIERLRGSECDHERQMSLYLKHNDLATVIVDRLNIERDDYLPHIGIFGGDDTQFSVCMQCGLIRNWKPISDDELKLACRNTNDEGDDEDEVAEHRRQQRRVEEPIIVPVDPKFEQTRSTMLAALVTHCGANWSTDPDVRQFLIEQTTEGRDVYTRLAAKRLLETCQ